MSILVKEFIKNPKAFVLLDSLELEKDEKAKAKDLLTMIYHQQLLNRLLEELSEENKQLFFEKHLTGEEGEAITFLRQKIEKIENVVEKALSEIDEKIIQDLDEVKKELKDV